MFCKKCGRQNPNDAKFCMRCGSTIIVVEKKIPIIKVDSKDITNESIKANPNVFQKILLLISLVWFIVGLFYIPYKYHQNIIYNAPWANPSGKIDWLRVLLQYGLLFTGTFILYGNLRRFNTLEIHRYKKLARREFYLFLVFVFSIFVCGIYLFGTNFINKKRDQKLAEQITPIEQQIQQNSQKRKLRQEFCLLANSWKRTTRTPEEIVHGDFDNKINRYWEFLELSMKDNEWLIKYYNSFTSMLGNEDNVNRILREIGIPSKNLLQESLEIDSPTSLKEFISDNRLNKEDFEKDRKTNILKVTLNKLNEEKAQLVFYSNNDVRTISLTTLVIIFATFYLLRPLFEFIKGLFIEIK